LTIRANTGSFRSFSQVTTPKRENTKSPEREITKSPERENTTIDSRRATTSHKSPRASLLYNIESPKQTIARGGTAGKNPRKRIG
jgi:hypothetical protein